MTRRKPIVDLFAGGGGASSGIAAALGRGPDVAINHDADAIAMHKANHPKTRHFRQDVGEVDPRTVTNGRPAWLLWASPDCRHFSRAKGGKPVKKNIRSLAWVVVRWAAQNRPEIIVLENVREFEDWGPLLPQWSCGCGWKGTEGQATLARTRRRCPACNSLRIAIDYAVMVPDPGRKGLTFKRFVGRLRGLGYKVEWKPLNAADFGAPTHRRRLFLIARRDGEPIVWPEATHGDPNKIGDVPLFGEPMKPWRTAAECIDWSIPCPSIFDRKRPLAEATMRRIALGVKRYVLDAVNPFLVVCNHGGPEFRGQDLGEPMPTVTASRDAHGLIVPTLIQIGYGERPGQAPRVPGLDKPLGTCVNGQKHALIAPVLERCFGNSAGASVEQPMPTTTAGGGGKSAVVCPILVGAGGAANAGKPKPVDEPSTTVLPHDRRALVAAFLTRFFGGDRQVIGASVDRPLPTVTAWDHNGLVAANLVHLNRNTDPSGIDEPMNTVTSGGNHAFLVYSFLSKYFGTAIGVEVDAPLPTATGKDRFGLVTVTIAGETFVVVDIGMRMLSPRELARAQGFPDSYILTGTKTSQTHKIGNSVSPPVAEAIVRANLVPALAAKGQP